MLLHLMKCLAVSQKNNFNVFSVFNFVLKMVRLLVTISGNFAVWVNLFFISCITNLVEISFFFYAAVNVLIPL